MDDYAKNLSFLCSQEKSVSSICRKISINRQQFSRYLSGKNIPSRFNQEKISRYFKLDSSEFYKPHDAFIAVVKPRLSARPVNSKTPSFLHDVIESSLEQSNQSLRRYLGFYHSYYYSFGWSGYIVRALVCIYEHQGRICSKTIERMRDPVDNHRYILKYHGLVTMRADRLYIMESDQLNDEDFNLTILYRSFRSHIRLLSGLTMGSSSRSERDPCSTKIVYEFIGKSVDYRLALAKCELLDPNSAQISGRLKAAIDTQSSTQEAVLVASKID